MTDLRGGGGGGRGGEDTETGGDECAGGERERGERRADAHGGIPFLLLTVLTVRRLVQVEQVDGPRFYARPEECTRNLLGVIA
ncbi:hypothetical protein GCM10010431_51010 [Streptomyces kunmingensis]